MRRLVIVIGATLLGAGILATSVLANTVTPPADTPAATGEHRAKAFERLADVLSGLVQKGVITVQQKDAILEAVRNAAGRRGADERRFAGDVLKASADYLGISAADLKAQLRAGKSLAQIAQATPGKSRDGLVDVLDKAADARIKAAVDAGKLTPAQAEQLRRKAYDAIVKIVDHTRPAPVASR